MTFRHSFYISIAAHALAFGSAIAFAQFGSGPFLSSRDAMMVSLVSTGGSSVNGRESLPRHERPAVSPESKAVPAKNEMPDVSKKADTASVQQPGQSTKSVDIGSDDTEQTSSASGARQGTSAQFGIVTPPEWAILAAAIERTKNYPRMARERGIEGVVRIRFRLVSSGSVEKIEIVQSSGSEVLDNASISAVYRAAPLPYVSGWVEMPMKYVLK